MSDIEPKTTTVNVTRGSGGGGLYLIVGGLVAVVPIGGYMFMGTPGLHREAGHSPTTQKIDVTVEQPHAPAPAPEPERHR